MEKNRLEAFSDGVLAIIITIMVLELSLPAGGGFKHFFRLGPVLFAYFVSFLFVAIYWVNHHSLFRNAERINVKILWCNIAWMFVMSFIPFFTAWVGAHPRAWAPLCLYFCDMVLACITFHWMYYLICRENGTPFRLNLRSIVSFLVYALAAGLGGFAPIPALIVVALVSCWWIVPEKSKEATNE